MQVADGIEVRALNFKELQKVLSCAGDKRLKEIQLCLEGTQNILLVLLCIVKYTQAERLFHFNSHFSIHVLHHLLCS